METTQSQSTQARDATGKFAAAVATPAESTGDNTATENQTIPTQPEPSEEARKIAAFQRAAEDERGKRQKLEAELAYMRGKLDAVATQPAAQPATPNYQELDTQWIAEPSKTFEKRTQEILDKARWEDRVALSQDFMREVHDDYDAMEGVFHELVKTNPALTQSPEFKRNPARYAYRAAKESLRAKDPEQAPDALKAKIAELEKKLDEAKKAPPVGIPQTTAGTRSVGATGTPAVDPDLLARATTRRNGRKAPF